MREITRRVEFDAAHRVMEHESKCRNLHGHRYAVEITCEGELDSLGRVIDFGVLKEIVGGWIDEKLDHGCILNIRDENIMILCQHEDWKYYVMDFNPTAENLAMEIRMVATRLLMKVDGMTVKGVRVYETPNCWADA